MLHMREVYDKEIWENFLLSCKQKTFLQSWKWGEFQKAMRGKIWRFGFFENENLVSVALVVKVIAKRGIFLLVPHGPIVIPNFKSQISNQNIHFKIIKALLERLKELAREEEAAFIRINPLLERTEENRRIFEELGFRSAPIQMHPEASWKLDITPPEDDLFKNMRRTTRYLIRRAQENKDIKVFQSSTSEDVKLFSELHRRVSARQHFVPFSLEYLQNEVTAFKEDNSITIFWGKYQENIAAAAVVIFWSGIGFYHHAVSLPQYAKFSIPYLLQWEAIREAKRRGCILYDFWGYVNPKIQPNHPWAGPTLFKMGFGGQAEEYVKTQDLPLSWKYGITMIFENLRRIKRNL